jgi:hypothetical protein
MNVIRCSDLGPKVPQTRARVCAQNCQDGMLRKLEPQFSNKINLRTIPDKGPHHSLDTRKLSTINLHPACVHGTRPTATCPLCSSFELEMSARHPSETEKSSPFSVSADQRRAATAAAIALEAQQEGFKMFICRGA